MQDTSAVHDDGLLSRRRAGFAYFYHQKVPFEPMLRICLFAIGRGIYFSYGLFFIQLTKLLIDMASVIIKQEDNVVFQGLCDKLSPLGCECILPLELLQRFREECGRYKAFTIEMMLFTHTGQQRVCGSVTVFSLHRKSQLECLVSFRFAEMATAAHRMIAEHLSQPLKGVAMTGITPAESVHHSALPYIRLA